MIHVHLRYTKQILIITCRSKQIAKAVRMEYFHLPDGRADTLNTHKIAVGKKYVFIC